MIVSVAVGLPGAGKSTLLAEWERMGALAFDDLRRTDDLPAERVPWLAVTHPCLCRERDRESLADALARRYGPVEIQWTFFENDPDACARNAAARGGRDVGADIAAFSRTYAVPEGAVARPVHDASRPGPGR